jgi:hypothetical protein
LQRSFYSIDRSIRPKLPHFSRQVPNRPGARSGAAAMMVSIRSVFSRALDHQRFRNRQNRRAMLRDERFGFLGTEF